MNLLIEAINIVLPYLLDLYGPTIFLNRQKNWCTFHTQQQSKTGFYVDKNPWTDSGLFQKLVHELQNNVDLLYITNFVRIQSVRKRAIWLIFPTTSTSPHKEKLSIFLRLSFSTDTHTTQATHVVLLLSFFVYKTPNQNKHWMKCKQTLFEVKTVETVLILKTFLCEMTQWDFEFKSCMLGATQKWTSTLWTTPASVSNWLNSVRVSISAPGPGEPSSTVVLRPPRVLSPIRATYEKNEVLLESVTRVTKILTTVLMSLWVGCTKTSKVVL